ncbi:MAG: LamG domain-containing protein [Deltaproteobacteria bacterium]|nr:LamG domain-containing protein [Deltaproteobacteria bacterium]
MLRDLSMLCLGLLASVALLGCQKEKICQPGETRECERDCPQYWDMVQTCNPDGTAWSECACKPKKLKVGVARKKEGEPAGPSEPREWPRVMIKVPPSFDHKLLVNLTFDGQIQDSVGTAAEIQKSAVRFAQDRHAKKDGALRLDDPSASRLELGELPEFTSLGNKLSAAFWIRVQAGKGGAVLSHVKPGASSTDWSIGVAPEGEHAGKPSMRIADRTVYADRRVDDGKWHHVAVRRSRFFAYIHFWVDGRDAGERRGNETGTMRLCGTTIGSVPLDGGRVEKGLVGELDDVRIYSRMVIDDEIRKLAGVEKKPLPGPDAGSPADGN